MKTIKTRAHVENIKVLDTAADISSHAKNVYIKTKESAVDSAQPRHSSPSEYAADSTQNTTQTAAVKVAHALPDTTKKAYDSISRAKDRFQEIRNQQRIETQRASSKMVSGKSIYGTSHTATHAETARNASGKAAVELNSAQKGLKATVKGQVKATGKSVKTAEQAARETIKTARRTAKTSQAAAKSTKAAREYARIAAKKTGKAVRVTIRAMIAFVRRLIKAAKNLVAAIAAGGWTSVMVILIICTIALLVFSVFGIFFSGEPNPETGQTIHSVIADIDTEFTQRINYIINSNPHDILDMSGSRALWKHVLAVYTVLVVTDPDNPMEVAMMDDNKAAILNMVFWNMNSISCSVEDNKVYVDVLDDDGNPTGKTQTMTMTTLRIKVEGMSIDEMSAFYSFSRQQREWLDELLKPEYHSLWNALLYGITSIGDGTLIEIAESQIGNVGGEIYWRWYGFNSYVKWCACFVSWVANQAGYIDAGIIPRFSLCADGVRWFQARGQ